MKLKSNNNMCCHLVVKFTHGDMVETATSDYGDIVITIANVLDTLGYGEKFIEHVLDSDSLQIRIERRPMDCELRVLASETPDGNYMVKR